MNEREKTFWILFAAFLLLLVTSFEWMMLMLKLPDIETIMFFIGILAVTIFDGLLVWVVRKEVVADKKKQ
jgi:tryptophan-rich sensory protein